MLLCQNNSGVQSFSKGRSAGFGAAGVLVASPAPNIIHGPHTTDYSFTSLISHLFDLDLGLRLDPHLQVSPMDSFSIPWSFDSFLLLVQTLDMSLNCPVLRLPGFSLVLELPPTPTNGCVWPQHPPNSIKRFTSAV